jgi:benzoyl-CoA reductase subunit C
VTRASVVEWARERYEDLGFAAARQWLAEDPARRACGYLPVYAPREIVHACGFLPVGLHGGGDRLEIIRGDAFYQSYICHLPRSIIELAQSGRLDFLSAVLFPSTCDVIRNLSGMWKLLYPEVYVRYLDVPQAPDRAAALEFWEGELRCLLDDLAERSGRRPSEAELRRSVSLYNDSRRMVRALYRARQQRPWDVPTEELYLLLRAGEVVSPEEFLAQGRGYLAAVDAEPRRPRDNSRVIVVGAFCEQPPLGLIKSIERAGCYIVDDDFILGNRFFNLDVSLDGDPVRALAEAFVGNDLRSSVLYEADPGGKRRLMAERAGAAGADGIIFATPSFCDPALLDQPMLRNGAEAAGIPCIAFKYAENTGQFQQFREQAGTFSDSIKLWGAA